MTTTTDDLERGAAAAPSSTRPPWYRRRGFIIAASIAVIIGVSVIMDYPHHPSPAEQLAASRSVVTAINSDVASCAYAIHEAFTIHADAAAGTLTKADRARVPTLLRDDQSACSFTDSSIESLATIEPPASAARATLTSLVYTATLWSSSDADAATIDISTLFSTPHAAKIVRDLEKRERLLASDRALALSELATAARKLGGTLPRLDLPALPHPS